MDRTVSYFSYATGDPALALAARAAASIIDAVARRRGLPERSIVVCGRGLGGVIALLAASVCRTACSVCAVDSLASFGHLLEEEHYDWPAVAFLADALNHFDLPEIATALHQSGRTLLVANPRDGRRAELAAVDAERLYAAVPVFSGLSGSRLDTELLAFLDGCATPASSG
jgi:pimeloyl-ACP methyl ester carboxylesterase